jgi:hypothetical protein
LKAIENFDINSKENKELLKIKEYNKQLGSIVRKMKDPEKAKEDLKEKAIEEGINYLQKHQDKISNAQNLLSKLKRKYSYYYTSNGENVSKKINSLEDQSFGKRLIFGSQFQFFRKDPSGIDLSLILGYKFNKRLHGGITGNYRIKVQIDSAKLKISNPQDVYGASVFADYVIYKSFFARCEFESKNTLVFKDDKEINRKWVEGLMIGIGYDFQVYKNLKSGFVVQYNVLHSDDSPYRNPWQFRFGIFKK